MGRYSFMDTKIFSRDTHSYFPGTLDQNLPVSSQKSNTFAWEVKNLTLPGLADINDWVCVPLILFLGQYTIGKIPIVYLDGDMCLFDSPGQGALAKLYADAWLACC